MKTYDYKFVMFADDDSNLGFRIQSFQAESDEDARNLAIEYCKYLFAVEGPKRIEVAGLIVESVEVVNKGSV